MQTMSLKISEWINARYFAVSAQGRSPCISRLTCSRAQCLSGDPRLLTGGNVSVQTSSTRRSAPYGTLQEVPSPVSTLAVLGLQRVMIPT